MGVSGAGKSTIALALSKDLDYDFLDADWLHPARNLQKMEAGEALTDEDRQPWLEAVGDWLRDVTSKGRGSIAACSALKRTYRDTLRRYVPDLFFVYLSGTRDQIETRIEDRHHEFMPASLLESQFAILEPLQPDERGMRVDITMDGDEIVSLVRGAVEPAGR
jgi:gluconokinase